MNYIKSIIKSVLISFIILFIMSFFITTLNYFNILNYNITKIFLKIIIYFSIFIGSFLFGKTIKNKAWLEGIKFSLFYVILFLILNGFSMINILYYISFIISSILGSILGINTKKGD